MKIIALLLSGFLFCGAPLSASAAEPAGMQAERLAAAEPAETSIGRVLSLPECSGAAAAKTVKLDGHTHITAAGQEETRDGMVLNVTLDGNKASVGMYDFPMLTFKGLTFEGDFTIDSQGNILDFSNVRIKGFSPIKIVSVTGKVSQTGADIIVKGKAAVVFNFTIRYWSGK